MIRYSLTCDKNHAFDSWFQSAEAYDRLLASGQVTCGFCGSAKVTKSLMAPSVTPARQKASPPGALTTGKNPCKVFTSALNRPAGNRRSACGHAPRRTEGRA